MSLTLEEKKSQNIKEEQMIRKRHIPYIYAYKNVCIKHQLCIALFGYLLLISVWNEHLSLKMFKDSSIIYHCKPNMEFSLIFVTSIVW